MKESKNLFPKKKILLVFLDSSTWPMLITQPFFLLQEIVFLVKFYLNTFLFWMNTMKSILVLCPGFCLSLEVVAFYALSVHKIKKIENFS